LVKCKNVLSEMQTAYEKENATQKGYI